MEEGMGWRVAVSVVAGIGWMIFLVIWLFFYWGNYSWEQNLAMILLSLFIVGGILGIPWATWGLKHPAKKDQMFSIQGMKSRIVLSIIVFSALFIGLILWFWYYATPYAWYQNLAILIVAFLIGGGIMGVSWGPWGMKHQKELDELDDEK